MLFLKKGVLPAVFLSFTILSAQSQQRNLYADFKNPPLKYRPVPFWHLNGQLTTQNINTQVSDAVKYGFGGVAVLPVTPGPQVGTNKLSPGMSPAYLSEEYFARYGDILKSTKANGAKVILYDDIDFPSGTAGGKLQEKYPGFTRKMLVKKDTAVDGGGQINMTLPAGVLMSVVATNASNGDRQNLTGFVKDGQLKWMAPQGKWRVMIFTCVPADKELDFMDPAAVKAFIGLTYQAYYKRFGSYFGNTIGQTFFDDVGYYTKESGWTNAFNEKFRKRFGKDPALYYPALWDDIGPETEAARIAFFDTRAELLAEGFPKVVSEWDAAHGLKSSGHPPGNYELQPTDMNFDILKYYRHEHIPTMDAIFYYGHGREGYKLVSSAAALYDRPQVASETFGAISEQSFTIKMMYQMTMEIFARGINFLVPHGMWYDYRPDAIRIPPLVSPYNAKIAPSLNAYNDFAARSGMMLTGGRLVAEIGVIYPIASLQGFYHFQDKRNTGVGNFVPPGTDYLAVGNWLTNNVHRDFTFIHPEVFAGIKYSIKNKAVVLNNTVNKQTYRTLIVPGGKVISYQTLKKIKRFYDEGGKVIATTLLPTKSAEFGMDAGVVNIIQTMFPQAGSTDTAMNIKSNKASGMAIFIPKPNAQNLAEALTKTHAAADVIFENNPEPLSGNGMLSYIHKVKNGKNIYYFANSSNDDVDTYVKLRGHIAPQLWDPNTGQKLKAKEVSYIKYQGAGYTRFKLELPSVKSMFVVGE